MDIESFFWFRRDLRISDNAGLYRALKSSKSVQPVFIFDRQILDKLGNTKDARVQFLHEHLTNLKRAFNELGADLWIFYGQPQEIWSALIADHKKVRNIWSNKDYESYALRRDLEISTLAERQQIAFNQVKDHVIFEKSEVVKDDGLPYTVFTPYKRKWLAKLDAYDERKAQKSYYLKSYPTEKYIKHLAKTEAIVEMPSLGDMGFSKTEIEIPPLKVAQKIIKEYSEKRDYPALDATSKLGIHFRFGTISIREKARKAFQLNQTYLSELIWRDFYAQILFHFPHVEEAAFRSKYDHLEWTNNEDHFEAWKEGKTGYPLVDAGMRQLNATGYMHNRVRMVVASFLTKHLLLDWRWGEAYFAEKLLDFDLASNNGGWQWAAGCGTDAAPYFRIFNPESQLKKFDRELQYIKKWVPEFGTEDYPEAIIDHKFARERCLSMYKSVLNP